MSNFTQPDYSCSVFCECCHAQLHEHKPFIVASRGPFEYVVDEDYKCASSWSDSVRGDGHSYQGAYATREEAQATADFFSR